MRILRLRHLWYVVLLGGIACWLPYCTHDPIADLGGSEVVGKVVTSDQKPVSNAKLRALMITAGAEAGTFDTLVADVVYSDAKGAFRFDELEVNEYTLVATYAGDSLLLAPSRFTPNKDKLVDLGTLVMKAPGAIKGVVVLAAGGLDADINCSIAGTSFDAHTNRLHPEFTITGIFPVDTSYELTCWAPGYKRVTLDSVMVKAGMATVIPDTIRLDLGTDDAPAVAPEKLTVVYDTASGAARLSWQPVALADVHQYIVYSSISGEHREDTVSDSADTIVLFETLLETEKRTAVFQVAALDDDFLVGPRGKADTLVAIPPSWLRVQLQVEEVKEGSTVDTACVVVTYSSNLRHVDSIAWRCDSVSLAAKKLTTEQTSGADTLRFPTSAIGARLYVTMIDNSGIVWIDSLDAATLLPIDAWATVDSLNDARRYANACVVNGWIYVFGGCYDQVKINSRTGEKSAVQKPVTSVEVFDPAVREWKLLSGKMVSPRYKATSAVVGGTIYVFGGTDGQNDFRTVERYDPASDIWTVVDSFPQSVYGASSCVLDGVIYIIGGQSGTGASPKMLTSILTYTPATRSWGSTGSLVTPRVLHQAGVAGEQIIVCGGLDSLGERILSGVEIFGPDGVPSAAPLLISSTGRYNFGLAVVQDKVLVFGGITELGGNSEVPTSSVGVCALSGLNCSAGAAMPMALDGVATVVVDGRVFVVGGGVGGTALQKSTRSVYVYYP